MNDGNAILREIDIAYPAAKNMIELSETQDEERGDGTTSPIILGAQSSLFLALVFHLSYSPLSGAGVDSRSVVESSHSFRVIMSMIFILFMRSAISRS
ncbi:hypothetical protein CVT25_009773 [Psilocybe cyanescens]|uniref:Uncharacterized protein n=1 Tax=Psilocybe cyanescens TaxID=93625 RepID=A0A409XQB8_PSICY|nr:hypothetical protein CVT25_009773 [Psilocybe cyanescens]